MSELLDSVLRGLIKYKVGIFVLLGLGFLIYLRKFIIGLREWQKSVFGLERELAKRMLVSASTGMILLLLLIVGEFLLVTVVGPQLPVFTVKVTPTSDSLTSPPPTRYAEVEESTQIISTAVTGQESLVSECVEDTVEITSPENGEKISGTVELIGSVDVENFGSYRYEYSTTGPINWVTIAAGDQLKLDESLGFWYTSSLTPGDYYLRLVPLNNAGEDLTPCVIRVEVVSEE